MKEIKGQTERGEEVKGGLLTHMLVTMEMSLEEIYANATVMLLAGIKAGVFVCVCVCERRCVNGWPGVEFWFQCVRECVF